MSKEAQVAIITLLAAILLMGCGSKATPTPTLEPTFSPTPEEMGDGSWDKVRSAGKLVVGTSADYPPFEFYTDDAELDGFDISLMDEVGRRLGIEIEYHDFAFDGLGSALKLGQIDAAIAAVSVTPDREAYLDFSNVYFVGQDGVLARDGSGIDSIDSIDDLSTLRIGTQRSSVQDDWLQTNLVDTGQLHSDQLLVYERADDAVRDLRQDRVDLVMLDAQPAEAYAMEGDIRVVGTGLNQQRYAIALDKGATSLKTEINRVLLDMQNEGFVAQLAKEYLDLNPEHILPAPTPTPTPKPEATSTPAPPPPCLDGLALVKHLNYDDDNMASPPTMKPGQPFTKGWQVKNVGSCTWAGGYQLVYAGGNDPAAEMGGEPVSVKGQVAPGETYDIETNLVAPLNPGTYQALWQMEDGEGKAFGERLPVGIQVPAPPRPTPAPTQTPVAGIVFSADRTQIKAGECVTFNWKVDNVKAVYFYGEGERWQDNGVTGEGSQQECPPHTWTYYLRVIKRDDSVETRQITVNVEAAPDAPIISRFTVDPPNQISEGQCVDVRWTVEGAVSVVSVRANERSLWERAPIKGHMQDCPPGTGTFAYVIEAQGPGGTSKGQQNINVASSATATPAPPPDPDQPVIHTFSVQPEQIPGGACVNISWTTGGGTSWVNIVRGEDIVWDNAPLSGTTQDCPEAPGDYNYRLVAFNPGDVRTREDRYVTVTP